MRIAIESPELSTVDFTEMLAAFKDKTIILNFEFTSENCSEVKKFWWGEETLAGMGGVISQYPPPPTTRILLVFRDNFLHSDQSRFFIQKGR